MFWKGQMSYKNKVCDIIHLEVGEPDFDVLEHAHVGVTPGVDFGTGDEGYVRFSYANSLENIKEGLERISRYLSRPGF